MRVLKIILLIALASLLEACTHTDENGAIITKSHWFAQANCNVDTNS